MWLERPRLRPGRLIADAGDDVTDWTVLPAIDKGHTGMRIRIDETSMSLRGELKLSACSTTPLPRLELQKRYASNGRMNRRFPTLAAS